MFCHRTLLLPFHLIGKMEPLRIMDHAGLVRYATSVLDILFVISIVDSGYYSGQSDSRQCSTQGIQPAP